LVAKQGDLFLSNTATYRCFVFLFRADDYGNVMLTVVSFIIMSVGFILFIISFFIAAFTVDPKKHLEATDWHGIGGITTCLGFLLWLFSLVL
jgi:hypothetical protein